MATSSNQNMEVQGFGKTSVGMHRKTNEDAFFVDNDIQLYVVSDGMGGGPAGEVASSTAVEAVERVLGAHGDLIEAASVEGADTSELVKLAIDAIQDASEAVYNLAQFSAECGRAGCTMTMLIVVGNTGLMAHVGDSRLYLSRNGRIHQLSTDHTMAASMVQQGILQPDQIRVKPFASNLTRAVGIQRAVQVDTITFPVLPGDRFLLCSDGLSDYIGDHDWLSKQLGSGEPEHALDGLIDHANASGGRDNVTAIVVAVEANLPPERRSALTSGFDRRMTALNKNFLFHDLSLVDMSYLLEASEERKVPAGETVIAANQTCSSLYVVIEGRFELRWYDRVLAELGHGDSVGAATLARPRPARADLVAVEDARVLVFLREAMRRVLWTHQTLGITLLERMGWRLSEELDLLVAWRRPRDGFMDRF